MNSKILIASTVLAMGVQAGDCLNDLKATATDIPSQLIAYSDNTASKSFTMGAIAPTTADCPITFCSLKNGSDDS